MEQWEKEYIDIVTKEKSEQENAKGHVWAYEEGYDSSRWDEVTNSDGTKYYVPKKSAFGSTKSKTSKKHKRNADLVESIAWLVTVGSAVVLVMVLIGVSLSDQKSFLSTQMTESEKMRSISSQGIVQEQLRGGTYVDGLGFANMMEFFDDMQSERHSFLVDVVQSLQSDSLMDVQQWSDIFAQREDACAELCYAPSYRAYVDAQMKVFELQKELLILMKHGAQLEVVLEAYNQLSDADAALRSKQIQAMDENGIRYTIEENKITYWYKQY